MLVSQRKGWDCTNKSLTMCCRCPGLARVRRQRGASGATGRPGVGLHGAALCFSVQSRPQLHEKWVVGGELPAVAEVEPIVEVRRVGSLRVLENGLQLIECFRQPGFGRA